MRERDKDFYDRLEAVGFDLDWGEDGSGLFMKYLRRGSGYYIDVGASELVANGDIKLVNGVGRAADRGRGGDGRRDVAARRPRRLRDGYGSMNGWAAELISQEVADKVGKVWGLGSDTTKDPGPWEGEQRNMWKPTQQEALWFHGGNLHQSRHYSLLPGAAAEGARWRGSTRRSTGSRRCTIFPEAVSPLRVRRSSMGHALRTPDLRTARELRGPGRRRAARDDGRVHGRGRRSAGGRLRAPAADRRWRRPCASADGDTLVTDGPFAETKDVFGGYYVIEADDLDARDRAGGAGAGGAHGRLRRDPPGAGVPALIQTRSATSGAASWRP